MMEQKSSLDQTSSESFFFFNPRTPCGVRQTGGEITWTRCWFQSTHSLRSATGDCASYSSVSSSFNPRTPCGVRLNIESSSDEEEEEVSIHALLAECDQWLLSRGYTPTVSIHALLAECDSNFLLLFRRGSGFNPRTPCGVRQLAKHFTAVVSQFQSTHSLRSATRKLQRLPYRIYRFNPRTPCGVRRAAWRMWTGTSRFQSTHSLRSATRLNQQSLNHESVSIHALLAECDSEDNAGTKRTIRFNPRTPCGVRLSMLRSGDWAFIVSIHALLAECDTITGFFLKRLRSFNPRTPCGVRLKADEKESILWAVFQSTHSLRSATKEHETSSTTRKVSIHALLAECDGLPQL